MRFLFKYPSRSRPEWFKQTLLEYYKRLSGKHEYHFLIAMDTDDASMANEDMEHFLEMQKDLVFYYQYHDNKIHACNTGIKELLWQWDIVVLISDDMVVTVDGFDDIIAKDMQEHFPDMDGLLHYPDGYRPKEDPIVTWTVMGRQFYERYGCLYHPDFIAQWCDDELTAVAESWGKIARLESKIVKHQWQRHGNDASYQRGHDNFAADKATYETRKAAGFPLLGGGPAV